MDIVESVKEFLNDLIASLQRARLYSTGHQIFRSSVDKTYERLQDILKVKSELIIGIVSQELAFEKEIFFELSNFDLTKKVIIFFQDKGIEKIVFYPRVSKEELLAFVGFLVNPIKEQIKMDLGDYMVTLGIRNIAVGKIQPPDESKPDKPIDLQGIYENYLKIFYECAQALSQNTPPDFPGLRIAADGVMEHVCLRSHDILKFTQGLRKDATLFLHSVNVSILAMYFSFKLGFSKSDTADMGIAALFHDIGRLFKDAKSHTRRGAQVILKYVDSFGVLPVLVSFGHHLKYNSRKYPGLPVAYKPHIAPSIVSICDIYDVLCEKRSPEYNYPGETIYNLMMKGKGRVFDPDLLDIFFRITGVWPVGTLVLLSDNSVAIVREENEEDIFSPHVEIISPAEDKRVIDLKDKKEGLKVQRALNPFTEGKGYLHLI